MDRYLVFSIKCHIFISSLLLWWKENIFIIIYSNNNIILDKVFGMQI